MASLPLLDNDHHQSEPTTPADLQSFIANMKDPSFQRLFMNFIRTLNDPEERKKFEEDMARIDEMIVTTGQGLAVEATPSKSMILEKIDQEAPVELIVPEKWFCVVAKTMNYQDYEYKEMDLYINVGWSERIADVKTSLLCSHGHSHDDETHDATGSAAPGEHHYQLPYTLDRTFKSRKLRIYDFVVGRKALRWARRQPDFQHVIVLSAVEAIEETFGERIDRKSLGLVHNLDYKWPPSSLTETQPSLDITSPPSILSPASIKLAAIPGLNVAPMSATPLTKQQQARLQALLTNDQPSFFSEMTYGPGHDELLKLDVPTVRFRQSHRTVTVKIDVDSEIQQFTWNVSSTSSRSLMAPNSAFQQQHGLVSLETPLEEPEQQLEIYYRPIASSQREFGFCGTLGGSVLVHQCYASISSSSIIIVLQKATPLIWQSGLKRSKP